MPKAFISILGTNNYLECRHKFPNGEISDQPVKYVQEDLIRKYCRDWDVNDEIRIFLTEEARKKNWLDNGYLDPQGNPIANTGLNNRIRKLELSCKLNSIPINEGFSENEIWGVFQTIYDTFRQDEEVIVDITHSFRSLPMLMITILNFAKQLKKIKVNGIYYAAFESLGTIPEVKKIPGNERITPVLDLTSFSDLQDWTSATYDFINNANVTRLRSLVTSSIKEVVTSDQKEKYFPIRTVDKLSELIDNIAYCRGKELLNFNFDFIRNELSALKNRTLPKVFYLLIDEIQNKIKNFDNDPRKLAISITEWCINHNYFQQAITILQEFILTIILKDNGLESSVKINRELVSQSFKISTQKIPIEKWFKPASENIELVEKLRENLLLIKLSPCYDALSDIRNDINHSGFLMNARSVASMKKRLNDILEEFRKIINNYANQSLQSSKE